MSKEREVLETNHFTNEIVHDLSIFSQHIIVAIEWLIGESGTGKIQRRDVIFVFEKGDHLVVIETGVGKAVNQHQLRIRLITPSSIEDTYLGSVIVFGSRSPFEIIAPLIPVSRQLRIENEIIILS